MIAKPVNDYIPAVSPHDPWQPMQEALGEFEPGLMLERDQPGEQRRELDSISARIP